ncbi:tRNA pseudouridine synthase B [Anoxybacillus gonensis]|uniref:tRNA pseudouridine synthase B n=1 Tax=Anoxybacillus gonensis TaxID=198467 RepID=A0AAW7TEM6_9BACL|nr:MULTISPECIES: tRNA pseudouridine(55) synthase TruB [Anoxybacillus]AKS38092.1 tRNA pseudouridine synthase B [Anoxybacillus gonensis]KGP60846.1 tRNA pseudouridine synthase B [Anoxybacillus gonensis]MCX8046753.1 tRNA pseudouridine(55) synthase TruB [Anoxybacillus gonensis]MDO0877238.1 tRNA pseudouridine(55) synthase TruB [Anoxybacillus gonensis]
MDGVLLLHKPAGMTSHDCVMRIRKLFQTKKVGHTGTLDPDVSGVLPICIGKATKIVELLTAERKTYEGEVTLGIATTTEDASGDIVSEKPIEQPIFRHDIERVFANLTGDIEQVPPMYSAVKVNGKKLYEYARAGIDVERPKRNVHIFELLLLDDRQVFTGERISFRFRVTCSKGTYVRTLAVQIGERLGYPAHMSHLVRTASGPFTLDQCVSFADIEQHVVAGTAHTLLLPIKRALAHFPTYVMSKEEEEKVKHGALLPILPSMPERLLMVNEQGEALAIYMPHPTKQSYMKPLKVL